MTNATLQVRYPEGKPLYAIRRIDAQDPFEVVLRRHSGCLVPINTFPTYQDAGSALVRYCTARAAAISIGCRL